MGTIDLKLTISPEDYQVLKEEADKASKSPEDLSAEVLHTFILQQQKIALGRQILRSLPQRAAQRSDPSKPTDVARNHDDHLYS